MAKLNFMVFGAALLTLSMLPNTVTAQELNRGRVYMGVGAGASGALLVSSGNPYLVVSGLPELRVGVALSARSQVFGSVGCTLLSSVTDFANNHTPPSTSVTALEKVPVSAALGFSTSLGDSPVTFSVYGGYGNFLRGDDPPVQGVIAGLGLSIYINTILGGR